MTAEPAAATRHTATYPGRAGQLRHVRQAVASHLAGCAAAAGAVLVASELAANAIVHSRSRTGHFTVRTELHPDHVRIETEDLGVPWRRRQPNVQGVAARARSLAPAVVSRSIRRATPLILDAVGHVHARTASCS